MIFTQSGAEQTSLVVTGDNYQQALNIKEIRRV